MTLESLPARTVLLVDDNATDRQIAMRYLRRDRENTYAFLEAETGEAALGLCYSQVPDCILLDHKLPDMTGLEFLAEIGGKSGRPRSAIVVMTGASNETIAVQAIKEGAQDYFVKGTLTPETLLLAVDNAIEKVRLINYVEAQQSRLERQNQELQARQTEIEALNQKLQRAMAESHHRIKNNLQALASLIHLGLAIHDEDDKISVSALYRMERHIRTLAALHDLLTQEAKGDADMDAVSLRTALERLGPMLEQAFGGQQIAITVQDDVVVPGKQASAFLLLVNELISNAVKHGGGAVEVHLSVAFDHAVLQVSDSGPGFPAGFDSLLAANTGLELIESIARLDLRGDIVYRNRPESGAQIVITFPLPTAEAQAAFSSPTASHGVTTIEGDHLEQ